MEARTNDEVVSWLVSLVKEVEGLEICVETAESEVLDAEVSACASEGKLRRVGQKLECVIEALQQVQRDHQNEMATLDKVVAALEQDTDLRGLREKYEPLVIAEVEAAEVRMSAAVENARHNEKKRTNLEVQSIKKSCEENFLIATREYDKLLVDYESLLAEEKALNDTTTVVNTTTQARTHIQSTEMMERDFQAKLRTILALFEALGSDKDDKDVLAFLWQIEESFMPFRSTALRRYKKFNEDLLRYN